MRTHGFAILLSHLQAEVSAWGRAEQSAWCWSSVIICAHIKKGCEEKNAPCNLK